MQPNDRAPLTIEPGSPADADAVADVVQRAYRDPDGGGWTTEAQLLSGQRIRVEDLRAVLARPDRIVLVGRARIDAADAAVPAEAAVPTDAAVPAEPVVVACCELYELSPGLAYFGMFAVRPDVQAGGIGRQMLAAAQDVARRRWGARRMEMTVIAQRPELIAWYGRRGFHRTGERRPFPYGDIVGAALRADLYFEVLVKDL